MGVTPFGDATIDKIFSNILTEGKLRLINKSFLVVINILQILNGRKEKIVYQMEPSRSFDLCWRKIPKFVLHHKVIMIINFSLYWAKYFLEVLNRYSKFVDD